MMADKGPAIARIVNKATGIMWEVPEGSPAHKRCASQPKAYEIMKPGQDEAKPPVVASPPNGKTGKVNS
jgi:hypothetical protein